MPRFRRSKYQAKSRWTAAEARVALSALAASGLSVSQFAQRSGLEAKRLYRWRERLGGGERSPAESGPSFVELQPSRAEPLEIVLRSGRVMRVPQAVDPAVLLRLVAVLEKPDPC